MTIRVYLAGPFTAIATSDSGIIDADSPWRHILEDTERALGDRGWHVFLPHRDVSAWGLRKAPPEQIATECLEAVLDSDCVVAVLGESFGTHVEVGTAIGRNIPTIVIDAAEEAGSFFGKAVTASGLVTSIRLDHLGELPATVASERFDQAVQRAGVLSRCSSGPLGGGSAADLASSAGH
ncbi:hypothetical protein AB0392_32395 [Nonomuraea angiospora]|uniref:hypothetical protein n=1 Tax=Nonomuraea angiospora TaxID=46172 RepID=UPI00344DDE7E